MVLGSGEMKIKISTSNVNLKSLFRLAAPALAIAGYVGMTILPVRAITDYPSNDYRVCAARLKNLGISTEDTARACAEVLRPRDFSACVVKIAGDTQIEAIDAVRTCSQVRRHNEFASCVVGIINNTQTTVNPEVLNYCRRSLLPLSFAKCVVGFRTEMDFDPRQAMDTCIDASDSPRQYQPSFLPVAPGGPTNPVFPSPNTR